MKILALEFEKSATNEAMFQQFGKEEALRGLGAVPAGIHPRNVFPYGPQCGCAEVIIYGRGRSAAGSGLAAFRPGEANLF